MQRHLANLFALLAISGAVQTWAVWRSWAPAPDAVRYVAMAEAISRDGLLATVRDDAEHPLFPGLVWLTHAVLETVRPGAANQWAASVQLAAVLPLVLTVVPVYLVLWRLFDRRVALGGGILFCVLTEVAALGASGLSDSVHLLLAALALWCLVEAVGKASAECGVRNAECGMRSAECGVKSDTPHSAFRIPHFLWFFPAGLALGLALMARAEVVVLLPSLGVALVVAQMRPMWRQPWRRIAAGLAWLALGLGLGFGPYLVAARVKTVGSAVARVRGHGGADDNAQVGQAASQGLVVSVAPRLADGETMTFEPKESRRRSSRFEGHVAAVGEYFKELATVLQYWIGGLAAWGLWRRLRLGVRPVDALVLALAALVSAAAIQVAASAGYLAGRHLALITIPVTGYAAWGAFEAVSVVAGLLARLRGTRTQSSPHPGAQGCAVIRHTECAGYHWAGWALVALAAVACLPKTLAPLHAGRAAHRRAGEWLAREAQAEGLVLDTWGVTALYSGRPTRRYDAAALAFRNPRLAYVVILQRELEYASGRSRTLRELLNGAAERVAVFPDPKHDSRQDVVVYRWWPELFAQRFPTAALAN